MSRILSKYTKNQLITIFLGLLLVLSALVIYIFWNDYGFIIMFAVMGGHSLLWNSYTALLMVVFVWTSMLLLRSVFPKYFSGRYVLCAINFLALYALLNVWILLYDQYLDYKLAQFDINHDSIFSPQEQTAEQQRYMDLVIWDTGRNFMPFYSLFTSFESSFILFFILKYFDLIIKRKETKTVQISPPNPNAS